MAMVKIVRPSGWDFDQPDVALIKVSSRGLVGADRKDFIKRAGDAGSIFLPYLDSIKFADDEEPVHQLAVGAYERWAGNRNGDRFSIKACQDYHDAFVKFAKPYRNHRNRSANGDPYFGVVKLSAYNPTMHRIELLVALNKTKSAADRNGGQIADKELAKLASDGEYGVSMAARVSHDVCSYCGNKAATRDDYCTQEKCAAGGCKDNLTRLVKVGGDIHHLGVDNPEPFFFDISHVFRPADRTAYSVRPDWLKAAGDSFVGIGGAKLAEELGVMAPLAVILAQDGGTHHWNERVRTQVKLAHGLAQLEECLTHSKEVRRAFTADMQPSLDFSSLDLDLRYAEKTAGALGALALQTIILPLREFARLTKQADLVEQAQQCLKGTYSRMLADGSLERRIETNRYAVVPEHASLRQKSAAAGWAPHYSLAQERVEERVYLSALRGQPDFENEFKICKSANDNQAAEELARQYALYKLAALVVIATGDDDFLLTAELALHQNEA